MSNIPSVKLLLVGGIVAVLAVFASSNWDLWAECLLAIPIVVSILGGKRAHAIMVFMAAMSWLQVVGDVLAADMAGDTLSQGSLGRYRVAAISVSLVGILALAIGMRLGAGLSCPPQDMVAQPRTDRTINPNRLVIAYILSLAVVQVLEIVARFVPALTQPILAFAWMKFVFMYLLATTVFETGRGQHWLALVLALEVATGILGYLGTYQNAIFIVLIALAASRGRVSAPMLLFGSVCAVFVVWMSLVWSVVKFEYRSQMFDRPLGERIDWMVTRLFVDPIDYGAAATRLARRLGYTELFAVVMARDDVGLLPATNLYSSAVLHVFMPRVLFPDKGVLDDSKITMELTGISIQDGTSAGIGYFGEAFADFGFPGMLVALAMFGLSWGGGVRYFMTRSVPWRVRQACAASAIFFTCRFETDIDKAFGAFLTAFLAMAVALKYGYPMIDGWLTKNAVTRLSLPGPGLPVVQSTAHLVGKGRKV